MTGAMPKPPVERRLLAGARLSAVPLAGVRAGGTRTRAWTLRKAGVAIAAEKTRRRAPDTDEAQPCNPDQARALAAENASLRVRAEVAERDRQRLTVELAALRAQVEVAERDRRRLEALGTDASVGILLLAADGYVLEA